MAVLKCPVCDCDAIESSGQGTLPTQQSVIPLDDETVVCHCALGHRFIVSAKEWTRPQSTSGGPASVARR